MAAAPRGLGAAQRWQRAGGVRPAQHAPASAASGFRRAWFPRPAPFAAARRTPSRLPAAYAAGRDHGVAAQPQRMRRAVARAAAADSSLQAAGPAPQHLVCFVNGLTGAASDWDFTRDQLRTQLPPHLAMDVLLHASEANSYLLTWGGVDGCGQRLADEVQAIVARNPQLARISFVAHSMGGLIARYAVGKLYNPQARTVAGLQPAHFVTMATPHLGCDSDGVAAVPFIDWTGAIPYVGAPLQGLLQGIAHTAGAFLLARTGEQFFLLDGAAAGEAPLLVQMTLDVPERGRHFIAALESFATRTAYGNADGDHLVGHANSSLRPLHGLPPLPPEATRSARGVVLEDPLSAAFHPADWLAGAGAADSSGAAAAAAGARAESGYQRSAPYGTEATADHDNGAGGWHKLGGGASNGGSTTSGEDSTNTDDEWGTDSSPVRPGMGVWGAQQGGSTPAAVAGAAAGSDLMAGLDGAGRGAPRPKDGRAQRVAMMLERLAALPWRRIDVSFGGASFGFAHNNIQVTRRILNFQGAAVPRHLADQLARYEEALAQRNGTDTLAS